jgi:hypothetical protein
VTMFGIQLKNGIIWMLQLDVKTECNSMLAFFTTKYYKQINQP